MAVAITEAITTLAEAERRFNLTRTEDEAFFSLHLLQTVSLLGPYKF